MKQQVTRQVSNVAQQVTQLTSDLIQRGLHVRVYWIILSFSPHCLVFIEWC